MLLSYGVSSMKSMGMTGAVYAFGVQYRDIL